MISRSEGGGEELGSVGFEEEELLLLPFGEAEDERLSRVSSNAESDLVRLHGAVDENEWSGKRE